MWPPLASEKPITRRPLILSFSDAASDRLAERWPSLARSVASAPPGLAVAAKDGDSHSPLMGGGSLNEVSLCRRSWMGWRGSSGLVPRALCATARVPEAFDVRVDDCQRRRHCSSRADAGRGGSSIGEVLCCGQLRGGSPSCQENERCTKRENGSHINCHSPVSPYW